MSKEHIWPDWLEQIIPRGNSHRQGLERFEYNREKNEFRLTSPMSYREEQGCLSQRKVRNVCEECNNGWMSRAVNAAKPIARPLLLGERRVCDASDLLVLLRFLSITIIMQEFVAWDAVHIPPGHRSHLKNEGLPPDDWTVWVGFYGGEVWRVMGHTHLPVRLSGGKSLVDGVEKPIPDCFIQSATFTMRNMLVHAFTATMPGLVSEYRQFVRDENWNLFQLWPSTAERMAWPRYPILDGELDLIINKFTGTRWGYRSNLGLRR